MEEYRGDKYWPHFHKIKWLKILSYQKSYYSIFKKNQMFLETWSFLGKNHPNFVYPNNLLLGESLVISNFIPKSQ